MAEQVKAAAPKKNIASFVNALGSVQYDRFVRVIDRLEFMGAPLEVQCLEAELAEVKKQIQIINQDRDKLRVEKDELAATLADLDRLVGDAAPAQDLVQMRLLLLNLVTDLDAQIARTRPVKLHERKAQLKKSIRQRGLLAELAGMIRRSVAK